MGWKYIRQDNHNCCIDMIYYHSKPLIERETVALWKVKTINQNKKTLKKP
jgi:hypothetical protein